MGRFGSCGNSKYLDFKDVEVGMICEDYNGTLYEVVDKGSFAEMCRKTHCSMSDYGLEDFAYDDAVTTVALDNPDEITPWLYDSSGVLCYTN